MHRFMRWRRPETKHSGRCAAPHVPGSRPYAVPPFFVPLTIVFKAYSAMSNQMRKLAGQTMVYGISTVLVRLLNYLLVPYLTRVMGRAQYGVVSHIYAVIPFVLVILTMGLESGYFRFAGKASGEGEKRRVFATAWGMVSLVSVLFFVLVLLFNGTIAEWMGYAAHPSYIWMTGAIVALDAVTAIPFARLREQSRSGRYVLLRSS